MEIPDGRRSIVIGTAGHVDHGKSSLVKALTGIDPDRLPEEKLRGMTTDLGFAHMVLPNGVTASFVDVPGHERLVATMVAGAGGFDGAMLVVAANEGVMPQTREHVAILDLLGVSKIVVVINKSDTVDAAAGEAVLAEVRSLLATTTLTESAAVFASARSGLGTSELQAALATLCQASPATHPGVPRLPIDRVFTVKGFGTVVTGTLIGARLSIGDHVEVLPGRVRARIRGVQTHGVERDSVAPGERAAVNLSGFDASSLSRGSVAGHPDTVLSTRRFEALVTTLPDEQCSLATRQEVTIHAGTAASIGTVFPFSDGALAPDRKGWVQVRLERPMVVWRGQRFIIRTPSPASTIAGGVIADVKPRRRARAQDLDRLGGLLSADIHCVIQSLLMRGPQTAASLSILGTMPIEEVSAALTEMLAEGTIFGLGNKFAGKPYMETLRNRALTAIETYHSQLPLRGSMPRAELQHTLRLDSAAFHDLMSAMVSEGVLINSQPSRTESAKDVLTANRSEGYATAKHTASESRDSEHPTNGSEELLVVALREGGFAPEPIDELMTRFRSDREHIRALADSGRIVRIADWLYLDAATYRRLIELVEAAVRVEGGATVAAIRDVLGSSRKYALAVLDHTDGRHITRRVGDLRVPGEAQFANRR